MPRILLTSKSELGVAFIPWARKRYELRTGIWWDAPHEKVLIQYNTGAGTILIKAETGQNLVCNPYNTTTDNYNSHFFLDASKDKIYTTETDDSWKDALPTDVDVELVDEALFGNYIVSDAVDNNYSIIAPVHHLASEPNNEILVPGYTRYAWTTNVTGKDIHTCYSEYVYQNGEAAVAGTRAAPESEFQYGLIVGIGVDAEGNLHCAQLVQIQNGQGYWSIFDKDGNSLGMMFGSEGAADSESKRYEGTYSIVWKNVTDTNWWVEFFTGNGLGQTMLKNFNIYDRVSSSRAGGVSQWFYRNGEWLQNSTQLHSVLAFKGLSDHDGYKKTVYEIKSFTTSVNSKPVTIDHEAISLSGVKGRYAEKLMNVYRVTDQGIQHGASDGWPTRIDSYYWFNTWDVCNPISVSMSGLPSNFVLSELRKDHEYHIISREPATGCDDFGFDGSISAVTPYNSVTVPVVKDGSPRPTVSISGSATPADVGTIFTASGGVAPYTYSATGGAINGSTGAITGIPSCPVCTGTVTATDACGNTGSIDVAFKVPGASWVVTQNESFPYGSVPGYTQEWLENTAIKRRYRWLGVSFRSSEQSVRYQYCRSRIYGCDYLGVSTVYDWNTWKYGGTPITDPAKWIVNITTVPSGWMYLPYVEGTSPCGINRYCDEYNGPECIQYYGTAVAIYYTAEWKCP